MKKWLTLRINNLPFLAIEVNNTYEKYLGKLKIIKIKLQDLIDIVKNSRDKDKYKEFKQLQKEVFNNI